MRKIVIFNRSVVAAALVAVALTWLVPVGAARAQTTVGIGRPGDHWASTLAWTHIGRGEKDGAYGYVIKLRAEDGCEVELFYPRGTIDFQGQGRTWQNSRVRVKTGWLHYPSRLNARSLPKVHPGVLEVEDHYQRQADGAIAAAQGFALVATLGTMTPAPRPVPTPRTPRTHTPRVRSPRTTPPRTAPTPAAPARTSRDARPASANGSRAATSAAKDGRKLLEAGVSDAKMWQLGKHFKKHGRAMGFRSKAEYDTAAKLFARRYRNHSNAQIFEGVWGGRGQLAGTPQRAIVYRGRAVIVDVRSGQVVDFYMGSELRGLIHVRRVR